MGLVYIKPFLKSGSIGLWNSEDIKTENEIAFPLTEQESQQLKTIKSEKRKTEWLSVRLLFHAMRNDTNCFIDYHASGKPFLVNSNQEISITHSGKYTAILLSDSGKPGIDLQCFNPSILNAPDYFLMEKELAAIGEEQKFLEYHRYWCAKETFYKCFSDFAPDMKNDIYIHPGTTGNTAKGTIKYNGGEHQAEAITEHTEEYVLAACIVNF